VPVDKLNQTAAKQPPKNVKLLILGYLPALRLRPRRVQVKTRPSPALRLHPITLR
jgi:hypothetical protein